MYANIRALMNNRKTVPCPRVVFVLANVLVPPDRHVHVHVHVLVHDVLPVLALVLVPGYPSNASRTSFFCSISCSVPEPAAGLPLATRPT